MITLILRRARRDLPLHLATVLVVALASALVIAAPFLITQRINEGAREAVADAGSRADVLVHSLVGDPNAYMPEATPEQVEILSQFAIENLPPSLAAVARDATPSIVSPLLDAIPVAGYDDLAVKIALISPAIEQRVELIDGRLPMATPDGEPTEVVISSATAEATGFTVGSAIEPLDLPTRLVVVGIVDPEATAVDSEWPWQDVPAILEPTRPSSATGRRGLNIAVLTDAAGIEQAQKSTLLGAAWDGLVRIRLSPEKFTNELRLGAIAELTGLEREASVIAGGTFVNVRVTSGFIQTLEPFSAQVRASVAQMTMMVTGVGGVALLALVLVGRLLVQRRSRELGLERARGANLASVGLRALAESIIVALLGGALGIAVALIIGVTDVALALVVVAVAALAPAVQAVLVVRGLWSGRREPANRADRVAAGRQRKVRRLVVEGTVLALAAGSLYAIRSRGLLQTRSDGVDPLLASAPVLLALAASVLILRLFPVALRAVARGAAHSRGALGILGATQAQRSIAVVPVLALTLAAGLGVGGALLIDTVHRGQVDASWERVGADARLDGPVAADDVATVLDQPGVEAATAIYARTGTELAAGSLRSVATLLAVGDDYAALASRLPGAESTAALELLAETDDAMPILVDPILAERLSDDELTMNFGTQKVEVQVVGVYGDVPDGYINGPFFFADHDALLERLDDTVSATSILAVGPGAAAALESLDRGETLSRPDWLAAQSGLALVSGVEQFMTVATLAIALFALIALVSSVLAGTRDRARSLALLRTLGVRARTGWWLVFAEVGPVVLASLVGGVGAGIAISTVLGPVLGLGSLAGGLGAPAPSLAPLVILGGAASAFILLVLATLAEYLAHRRDRLGDVLRVGDTQ
jgi:putative ABC transport system permease protein